MGGFVKKLFIFTLILLLFGCCNKDKTQIEIMQNFAAVWELETEDYNHFKSLLPEQSAKLFDYYNKGLVENKYFVQGEDIGETYSVGTILFVIREKDEAGAKTILDAMPFVQSKIATYKLYPLGVKWLTRTDAHKTVATNAKQSFVVVWISKGSDEEMSLNAKQNAEETLKLYDNGIIENAYMSPQIIEGTKEGYPVIYFINAKDHKSAKAILDELHFVKMDLATYELRPVGNFWLGS